MFDDAARAQLKEGLSELATAVKVTLGPTGKNVILQKSWGSPKITKDGVSVSKEIELQQPFKNMGAKMVNQAASKTADVVGDGTTTATILAEAIYTEGLKHVTAGANPMAIQRGIIKGGRCRRQIHQIDRDSRKRTRRHRKSCRPSAQTTTHPVGELLADAMDKVGKEGVIEIEEGKGTENEAQRCRGYAVRPRYISPYFMTNPETLECVLEDALYPAARKETVEYSRDLFRCWKKSPGRQPIADCAEDIEGEALAALVINRLQGVLKVCAVKAPGFGDRRKAMLGDMACINRRRGDQRRPRDKAGKNRAFAIGQGKKDRRRQGNNNDYRRGRSKKKDIKPDATRYASQIEKTTSDYDQEKLQERLAKLTGGVAVIKAGAATETEMKERKTCWMMPCTPQERRHKKALWQAAVCFLRAIAEVEKAKDKAKGEEKIGFEISQGTEKRQRCRLRITPANMATSLWHNCSND